MSLFNTKYVYMKYYTCIDKFIMFYITDSRGGFVGRQQLNVTGALPCFMFCPGSLLLAGKKESGRGLPRLLVG